MSKSANPASPAILVVRLGAMGDIVHTLPAVAALKRAYPAGSLTWLVEAKWTALLDLNPFVDRVLPLRRQSVAELLASLRALRQQRYDFAIDFQGLLKSAIAARAAGAERIFGFDAGMVRERAAAVFYTECVSSGAAHVVDRNLDLAAAVGADRSGERVFPLPPGHPEGELPDGHFVLASPLAGWGAKQWPLAHYRALAERLALPLVLNVPPGAPLGEISPAVAHYSGIPGLLDATRRAVAVVGVDSGPLHIAAALGKPGVAIFGPTDPARNGPHGGSLTILRQAEASTTYKRGAGIDRSMEQISPGDVCEALRSALAERRPSAGCVKP